MPTSNLPENDIPDSGTPGAPTRKAGRPREIKYALEKKFTLMMPKELHRALKIKAAEVEEPMTTMIIEAIKKTYGI